MENKEITNWKSWDPEKLKSEISTPLKDEDCTQTSSSDNIYKRKKYNNQHSKKTLDEVKTELTSTLKEYKIKFL